MWREIMTGMEQIISMGERGALATVIKSVGSTPRHEGSKMLVLENGEPIGTIGGGSPEEAAIRAAGEVMRSGIPKTLVLRLNEHDNPEGMLCGGVMHIFVEPVMENILYIFGGGHVSLAMAGLCSLTGTPYVICGSDAKLVNSERYADARECLVGPLEKILPALTVPPVSGVLIATRSAKEDEEVLAWGLERDLIYLGLLGSDTKRKKLMEKMKKRGLGGKTGVKLSCPAGVDIGAETPEEIAVSVMAEFISVMRSGRKAPAM